jgi:predicted nucleic acid-binding protein
LKTFLDSGVLISAWKRGEFHERAMSIMGDETREFLTCENVKLEVLPKPTFEKRRAEVEFYTNYFNEAADGEPFSAALGNAALVLAKKYGLSAGDGFNLASAIRQGAEEFITSELPGKPMFRVKELKVISLHSL